VARTPRSRKGSGRPTRRGRFPAKYSHEYPIAKGHDYSLHAIPVDVWERAKRRAHAQDRSIRVILIRALELFGSGRIEL
jgi:hypothetical protein